MAKESKPKAASGGMVLTCKCVHDYQDRTYGKGRRLHTERKSGYRCTVCGNLRQA
jgi:hypothetical protein